MSFLSIRTKWAKTKGKTASAIIRRAPQSQPQPQPTPSSALSSESFSSPYIVEISEHASESQVPYPTPAARSPHVNLELSTEPWFPPDMFASTSTSLQDPVPYNPYEADPPPQNGNEQLIVLSSDDGPITDLPEDDASAAGWEDVAVVLSNNPPRRPPKHAPTPIIIPDHNRLTSKARRRSRGHSTGANSGLLSVKPEATSPVYRDDDASVISGITLPGALIGGSFAVQPEPREHRSSRRITRTDSATLPRGEHPFLGSPHGRAQRQDSGHDWSRDLSVPPVPPLLIPGGDGSHASSAAGSPVLPSGPVVNTAPAPSGDAANDGNADRAASPTSTTSEAPPLSQTPGTARFLQTDKHPMHRISRITEASSPSLSSPATPERGRDNDSLKSSKKSLASPLLPSSPSPTSSYNTQDISWEGHETPSERRPGSRESKRPGSRSSGRHRGSTPLEVQVSRSRPSSRSVGSFLLHPDKFLPVGDRRVSTHQPSILHQRPTEERDEEEDGLVGLPSAALFTGHSESLSHLPAFPESARPFPESARLPSVPDTATTVSSGSPDTDSLTSPDPLDNVLLNERRATAKTDSENTPVTSPSTTPLNNKQTFPETPSEFSPFYGTHNVPDSESVSRTSSLNRGSKARSAARRIMSRAVSAKSNAHRKQSKSRSRATNRSVASVYSPSAGTSRTFQEARPHRAARALSEIRQNDQYAQYEQETAARAAAAAPNARIISNVPPTPVASPPPPPPPPKTSAPQPKASPPPLPRPSPRPLPAQLPPSQSIGSVQPPPTLSPPPLARTPPPRTPPPPRSPGFRAGSTPSAAADATPTQSTIRKPSPVPSEPPPDYAAATSSTSSLSSHAPSASTSSIYNTPPRRSAGRPPGPLGPRSRIASVSGGTPRVSQNTLATASVPLSHRQSQRRPSDASTMSVRTAPKFHRTQVKFKGHSMEAAQWILSSEELQTIVSRAIKQSAEPSFIRLLSLQALETDIPAEVRRLEALQAELKTKYKVQVRKRNVLFTAASTQADGGEVNVQNLRAKLDDLRTVTESMDDIAEQLYDARDQSAQLVRLASMHSSSALAVALRKLNASFLKRTKEVKDLNDKVAELEEERDEAWAAAQRVAQDLDELNDTILQHQDSSPASAGGYGTASGSGYGSVFSPSRSTSRRSSEVMASRKSSVRVSKAGLRNSPRRSNRESTSSSVNRTSMMSSIAGTMSPVDVPPVPPIPNRVSYRNSGYVSDTSPDSETREGAQALRDVLSMLGMDMDDIPAKSGQIQRRASLGAASPNVYSPRTAATPRFLLSSARSPESARSPGGVFFPMAGALSPTSALSPGGRQRSRSVSMLDAMQGGTEEDLERKAVLATLDTGMMDA